MTGPSPTAQETAVATDGAAVFQSSRWTSGNRLFPDRLLVTPRGIVYRKRTWFSSREEEIPWAKVASVSVARGVVFGTLIVETSGGSRPIVVQGLWAGAAEDARERIASRLGVRRGPAPSVREVGEGGGTDGGSVAWELGRQTALLEELVRGQREVLEELRRR